MTTTPTPPTAAGPDSDPVSALLRTEGARADAAHTVADAHSALADAMGAYRDAWRAARDIGWARTDLVRAGLIDPRRLPQLRRRPASPARRPASPAPAGE